MTPRKLILMVDNDWDRACARLRALDATHEVILCHSIDGAREAIEQYPFEVVMSDVDLGASGVHDLLTAAAVKLPDARRIVCARDEGQTLSIAHAVLIEPMSDDDLLAIISSFSSNPNSLRN